jgi:hypothetical protein
MKSNCLSLGLCLALVTGCAAPARYGMVKDGATGLQFGSATERNIFLDSSQFKNRTVKVTIRNTSGDSASQVNQYVDSLAATLKGKGYVPTNLDSFGLRVDLNVIYSGQIQRNMTSEFAFLGGAAGGVAGYRADNRGSTVAGALIGATVGAVLGSNVTEDTYIVVAEVSIGVADASSPSSGQQVITFGSSPPMQKDTTSNFSPFRQVLRTKIAVYAGGRNVDQQQVANEVRQRLIGIVGEAI